MKQVLTIAGSDSGGGAGIQADLKTFAALDLHGLSVITALTAQNSLGVKDVLEIPVKFIESQLDTVLSDFEVKAVKTGMLANSEIIELIALKLKEYNIKNLVVDPVMVAKSGDSLLQKEAVKALKEKLLPLTLVVTPNLDEAKAMADININHKEDLFQAASIIKDFGVKYVIIKGGHIQDKNKAIDTLFDGKEFYFFEGIRFNTKNTHGTGCTFSAALASFMTKGYDFMEAVQKSKEFITLAIKHSYKAGKGYGPVQPMGERYERLQDKM